MKRDGISAGTKKLFNMEEKKVIGIGGFYSNAKTLS
jgi:hypothetical protein